MKKNMTEHVGINLPKLKKVDNKVKLPKLKKGIDMEKETRCPHLVVIIILVL